MNDSLGWVGFVTSIIFSWPTALVVVTVVLRRPLTDILQQFQDGRLRRVKFGWVELEKELTAVAEKGKEAVAELDRTSYLMARSRLLELEITAGMFGGLLSADQRARMESHIDELRNLTATDEDGPRGPSPQAESGHSRAGDGQ